MPTKKKWWLWRFARYTLLALVLWQTWIVGWVLWWKWINPRETAFMAVHEERAHQWLPYDKIAKSLKQAVITAEDARFIDHDGFDWEGLEKALEKNIKRGKVTAGGSTISQQLAKNLFLSGSRSYVRKAHEAIITTWIEVLWDKERILEVYLNVAEWGIKRERPMINAEENKTPPSSPTLRYIYGAEMAARHYFGKSAQYLGAEESARLAVLLPAPRRYGQNINSTYINRRTQAVLRYMSAAQVP